MTDKTRLPQLLGTAIARARTARGMTKYRLAKLTGMHPQRITQIEQGVSGDLRLTSLVLICKALGLTPGQLLNGVHSDYSDPPPKDLGKPV